MLLYNTVSVYAIITRVFLSIEPRSAWRRWRQVCCGSTRNSFRELNEGVGVSLNKVMLRWGLLLLWCGLIFFGTANRHFTGESTHAVVAQAAPSIGLASARQLDWLNLAIRKGTHVVLFAVLGLLAWRAFETWPGEGRGLSRWPARAAGSGWRPEQAATRAWRPERAAAWAWLFVTLYAASDEFHQHFVPGRTASVWDVLLDSTAAAVVLLVVPYVASHIRRQKAESPR
jgi:hypothetical protein